MSSLYLIAHINGTRVAIDSDHVESLVNVHEVIPVPKCDPVVAGLFALRSRVLTLIDSQYLVTGRQRAVEKGALAVIAEIGGTHFGLLVDSVQDVVSIADHQFEKNVNPPKEWAALLVGIASVDGDLVMVIDPARIVNGGDLLAA